MTEPRRFIVDSPEGGLDAITMLGALSSQGIPLGVVVSILGGRSLPVAVRELTTLEHLAGGDLVVLLDPQGCTPAQVAEAVALMETMATNEVSSTNGPTWVLNEAPNRPLPTKGAFRLYLLDREAEGGHNRLEALPGLPRLAVGQSGIEGEVWEFVSSGQVVEVVEHPRRPTAP